MKTADDVAHGVDARLRRRDLLGIDGGFGADLRASVRNPFSICGVAACPMLSLPARALGVGVFYTMY